MRRAAIAAVLLAACGGSQKPGAGPMTPAQIAASSEKSIVKIQTRRADGKPAAIGTGFVVWADGRIATNLHILVGAHDAQVVFSDGRSFDEISVLAADFEHDLAILAIREKGLKALTPGDSSKVRAGDRVVAIGHPLGLERTVSDGLVSAVRELDKTFTILQISVPISPGSSGGPLFNERGEVIGVTTAVSTEGQNLNFAVPVAYLKPMLLSRKPVPLSELTAQLEARLFAGCKPEEVKTAVQALIDAIAIGAPLYNKGDKEGCFRVYEQTAKKLLGELKTCKGVSETLQSGLTRADNEADFNGKAWAMRHAFDRILEAFRAATEQSPP